VTRLLLPLPLGEGWGEETRETAKGEARKVEEHGGVIGQLDQTLYPVPWKRHPQEMGEDEITRFLSALAVHGQVSASAQNQALCALAFLFRHVLAQNLGWLEDVVHAKRPQRPPVVLTRPKVKVLLGALDGRALDYGEPPIWCRPVPTGVPTAQSIRD
jgi:hypothetical protein